MVIHLYTFVYNEEKILPHFFHYYEKFVDKFFVYDNQSTDKTKEIITSRKDTQYLQFDTDNMLDEFKLVELRNTEWKKSSREADWIIVCDADEFIWFDTSDKKRIKENITKINEDGYTVIMPEGYDMISSKFIEFNEMYPITRFVRHGKRATTLNKPIMFKPEHVYETNFSFGSHFGMPEGTIKVLKPNNKDKYGYDPYRVKLLHYKNLGLKYALKKKNSSKKRVSEEHLNMGIAKHYSADDEKFKENFKKRLKEDKLVLL